MLTHRSRVSSAVRCQLCRVRLNCPARNVGASTTGAGPLHPLEKHFAIVCHAVTNAARRTTLEKLLMVAITLALSGFKGLVNSPRARDAAALGMQFLRGPISDTKPHGQKTTSFPCRKVDQMTSPTSSHCVISVSSERTLIHNPAFEATCAKSRADASTPRQVAQPMAPMADFRQEHKTQLRSYIARRVRKSNTMDDIGKQWDGPLLT